MNRRFNFNWKNIGHAVKEFFIALGRGDLLTRLRVDRALPYILYLFFLGCISIWLSYHAEQTMLTVEKNNAKIRTLKIYHAQKTCEFAGMDRISTIEQLLIENGSEVKAPEKPANTIKP